MIELKKIYRNWRCVTLIVLAIVAFILAIAESDSLVVLAFSKVVAVVIGGICAVLAIKWATEGKIDELINISE